MEIKSEVRGSYSGQLDQTLYLEQSRKTIAAVDFSEFDGEVHVQMIRVVPEYRRQGLGKRLLQELQRRYPDVEIDLGSLTQDGAALIASIKFHHVTDPHLAKLFALQKRVATKLANLETLPDDKKMQVGEVWNRLYDLEHRLEEQLRWKKPTKKLINLSD